MKKKELLKRIEDLEDKCNNLQYEYTCLQQAFMNHIGFDIENLKKRINSEVPYGTISHKNPIL